MRKKVNYFLILIPLFLFILNVIFNFFSDFLIKPLLSDLKEKFVYQFQSCSSLIQNKETIS